MEKFVAAHARMLYVCVCVIRKILWIRIRNKKEKWSSWQTRHRYARFVNDEEKKL